MLENIYQKYALQNFESIWLGNKLILNQKITIYPPNKYIYNVCNIVPNFVANMSILDKYNKLYYYGKYYVYS